MNNEVRIHGYLCKSDPYKDLEFYNIPPKRVSFGAHAFWTHSREDSTCMYVPSEIMPELTWQESPVEVELVMSVEKVNK